MVVWHAKSNQGTTYMFVDAMPNGFDTPTKILIDHGLFFSIFLKKKSSKNHQLMHSKVMQWVEAYGCWRVLFIC